MMALAVMALKLLGCRMTRVGSGPGVVPPEMMSQAVSLSLLEGSESNLFDPLRDVRGSSVPVLREAGAGRFFVSLNDYTSKLRTASLVSGAGTSLITNEPIGLSAMRPPDHFSTLTYGAFYSVNAAPNTSATDSR